MDNDQSDVQVTLRNGESVKVNDHVYCSPSWAIRDGTPYSVARIMQFLPPENKIFGPTPGQNGATSTRKGKGRENWARVRLAWYYRPSDVSDRNVADSRLLLAAIYSEVCDINQLRSKCYVLHRDKITSLGDWKKRPDHFYFHRLFDPYIKREFEVLLSTEVRNLPQHMRDVLLSRYEYVVAEKEVVLDLTDQLRLCETCGDWCAHLDAVQCASCKNHFHMSCVSPPLLAKPSRGYGWSCAPCSRKREDRLDAGDNQQGREGTPKGYGPKGYKSRGRPRKINSGTATPVEVDRMQIKHFRMWPFRYFGLYTVAEDTLDAEDLIFPRAATRVGHKYQANVPLSKDEPIPRSSGSTSIFSEREEPDVVRGDSDTIETLGLVNYFDKGQVSILDGKMEAEIHIEPNNLFKVDWLVEIVRRASQNFEKGLSIADVDMKNPRKKRKWSDEVERYTDRSWTAEETHAFDDGIAQFGAELRSVRDEVGTRSMPEVVRYYGLWKNSCLHEENERIQDAMQKGKTLQQAKAMLTAKKQNEDNDNQSIVDIPPSTSGVRHSNFCAACRTRESKVWWKAPKGLSTAILCNTCGLNWRKYADLAARPVTREESAANGAVNGTAKSRVSDKREGTPLSAPVAKKLKVDGHDLKKVSRVHDSPERSTIELSECLCCWEKGDAFDVVRCKKCDMSLHAGLCGVDVDALREGGNPQDWLCDLCENEKSQDYSLNSKCVVCGPIAPSGSMTETFLRAHKPTEGQGWIHVVCSIYHPECQYSEAAQLRLVEGISLIPKNRWISVCDICKTPGGAVLRCSNCPKEFHVSCAWPNGNRFGFEIQAVKNTRRDYIPVVTFKGRCGFMAPVILCPDHTSYRSTVYEFCDKNDVGETALQVYARTYKQAPKVASYSLLRKAERLDHLMNEVRLERGSSLTAGTSSIAGDSSADTDADGSTSCVKCQTTYSPMFHPSPEDTAQMLCHACFFKENQAEKQKSGSANGSSKTMEEPAMAVEDAVNGDADKPRPELVDVVMTAV